MLRNNLNTRYQLKDSYGMYTPCTEYIVGRQVRAEAGRSGNEAAV